MGTEKRNYYRITYRPADRPSLIVDGTSYEVLDLSEEGVKYRHGEGAPAAGKPVHGTILFADHERLSVQGTVLRREGGDVVVVVRPPVPFARVITEQRRLIAKYKTPTDE